jgi:hypothetical protein
MTGKLAAAFDRCKLTDRDAVYVLTAVAEALGHKVSSLIINRSSIRRFRQNYREKYASKIHAEFSKINISAVTVHWDGKLLPSLTNKELVDRLPIVLSYNGGEKLIGVPQLSSGSGKNQALSIYKALEHWEVVDKVQAFCCDTTASNTGRLNGACIFLEQELNKNILYTYAL